MGSHPWQQLDCNGAWAVLLSVYNYDIKYKSAGGHGNTNGLSRLPLPSTDSSPDTHTVVAFNIGQVQALLVTCQDIQQASRQDTTLSEVFQYV